MSDSSERTLTPILSLATLPTLDCTNIVSPFPMRSTPFAYSTTSERFEYPFPIIQPVPSPEFCSSSLTPTQALASGSIVPPSATGRGMSMCSFASFAEGEPPRHSEPLPYPPASAAIAVSQSLNRTQFRDTLIADEALYHHRHTASELCVRAGTNPPMPPSLALKRRSLHLDDDLRAEDDGKL
ncbi:hypothetical protein BDN70DRAFT_931618 [Pholiota conissans]|uniref:Uncharacterized protein n=1 Tax=Pholiota conissans TaxID=109636 RepID=A0A9P5Z5V1_9AGAR|nr:hypothetical protein BDN70DRAFT_931618 [Pholiota conissans]